MIRIGDFVRHDRGVVGRVREIQGPYLLLEDDGHRYAISRLTVVSAEEALPVIAAAKEKVKRRAERKLALAGDDSARKVGP